MIVGSGMLAKAFAQRFAEDTRVIVFASGVSNSSETRDEVFARERRLLWETLRSSIPLLYFSSCGVGIASERHRAYIAHKAQMEGLVLETQGGRVIRLPQVVGRTDNPNTLTNFLRNRILAGELVELWTRAERNLIDLDDVVSISTDLLDDWPEGVRVVDVAAPTSVPMREIVAAMEDALGKRAVISEIDAGDQLPVDATHTLRVAPGLGIEFDAGYTARLLRKYYRDDLHP